jgi:hypothetical protein
MPLAEARASAERVRRDLRAGVDPLESKAERAKIVAGRDRAAVRGLAEACAAPELERRQSAAWMVVS